MPVFVYLDVAGKNLLTYGGDCEWLPIDRLRAEDFTKNMDQFAHDTSHLVAMAVAAQLAKESCHVTPVNVNVVLALVDQGSLAADMAWIVRLTTGKPSPDAVSRVEIHVEHDGSAAVDLQEERPLLHGHEVGSVACGEGDNLAEAINDLRARLDAKARETSSAPRAE